jgi:serum/glucocorticoid-regulated kinase 2
METQLPPRDKLDVRKDTGLCNLLNKGEHIFWSQNMFKINTRRRHQERRFILTATRFLNVGDTNFGDKFTSFFKGSELKRAILLKDITAITVSEPSNQFILHCPTEYDYAMYIPEERNDFLWYLITLREKLPGVSQLQVHLAPMIDLWDFVKWERSPAAKRPPGIANKWSCHEWKKFYTKIEAQDDESVKGTVVLFDKTVPKDAPKDVKPVNEKDFDVLRTLGRGGFGKVVLACEKRTKRLYAVKILDKSKILQNNQVAQLEAEKEF